MEATELEPRAKPLGYKVKAISRESPAQKSTNILDTDLRSHWSTATNTKEWILLELDEPALLFYIRIYNKSVLEWEISAGLRYKPEAFVKVRPRSEAPRRDVTYPINYTPCRYVRISCMRGNPIAIFFIQLIGIPVAGLEPEFQPVVDYLMPHIMSKKQDTGDMHLQLLQDVTSRLARFLPHLEVDLNGFSETAESSMRFLAMLAGPFYPILQIVNERETARLALNGSDHEASKPNLSSTVLTVSSNFEPRRSRNISSVLLPISSHVVFRPDAIFALLRKAYKDPKLGDLCRTVSRVLVKLMEPIAFNEPTKPASDIEEGAPRPDVSLTDYSDLFGEEFQIPNDVSDRSCLNLLDIAVVEEGLMHVLYGYASQPLRCSKLAEKTSDIWLALPLIQALLPALRPTVSSPYQIDDNFSHWKQPFVQKAMSQIVATSSSMTYRPLLRACAGYLTSFSPSHAKAACVLIDLCSGVLAPWIAQVVAKVDLAVELLEDLLGVIQGPRILLPRARAALIYIILALSGNMDDIMAKYKDAKYRILFLVEMLEPFLGPAVHPSKGIVFGNESSTRGKNQEKNCAIAVNVIHKAVGKSAVLPTLETEWRRGSVSPSVLLSVLDAQMQLPPDIDRCKFSSFENVKPQSRLSDQEIADIKVDTDTNGKVDVVEDASFLFAPTELNTMSLIHVPACTDSKYSNLESENVNKKESSKQFPLDLDVGQGIEFYNLVADYSQLMNYRDCELKASEFRSLAMDLNSQNEITLEGQDVSIDALLLAAECYIVPHFKDFSPDVAKLFATSSNENRKLADINKISSQKDKDLKLVADIERRRDRVVIELLMEAAELDNKYRKFELDDEITDSCVMTLSEEDTLSADAASLIRQNQSLLCNFLIRHLKRDEKNSTHEILMWCLLFLLHSATKLHCSPEHVVDVILDFAESLNMQVKYVNYQLKEGNATDLSSYKLYELQRRWTLLQRLVVASSGSDERSELSINVRNGFRFSNLVPNSAWLLKVSYFSSSPFPLVRYFGWMAMARNAKQFLNEHLFLVSDLSQLSYLLAIFSDDLSLVDNIVERKNVEGTSVRNDLLPFHALDPEMCKYFPNFKKEFESFGESMLEAVGLQLKFLSSTVVPDLISWFSNLCSWPFVEKAHIKGFVAKNAKAVILYILEAIVVEHMEAMVPEIPRLVQVLVSLCGTSYCDVAFLDSVLCLLKPIIIYSLGKVSDEEKLMVDNDESCDNYESLCFRELFNNIRSRHDNENVKGKCPALTIFVLATIFGDLSIRSKSELLKSAILWAEFALSEETTFFHDYLCAYQVLIENCKSLLVGNLRVWGIIPVKMFHSDSSISSVDDFSKTSTLFLNDMCQPSSNELVEKHEDDSSAVSKLMLEEIKTISHVLDALILKLNPTVEKSWKIHHKLGKKLAVTSAECFIYSRYLSLSAEKMCSSGELVQNKLMDECVNVWKTSLAEFANIILTLQENHCWEVAFVYLNSILRLPNSFRLDSVIGDICSAVKNFSNCAPNISWRLRTDKLISLLLSRKITDSAQTEIPFIDLFSSLLGHAEPEQRYIALKQLGRLVGQEIDGKTFLPLASEITINEWILSPMVSSTWDRVALMASSDTSLLLRTHATVLLISYIPLAERNILQSFLTAADSILQCLMNLALPTCYGPLTQFSLALIASVCLYSPAEDISLIPESIWSNIETIAASENGRYCTSFEKQACDGLWKLKNDEDNAKQILKEVLSSCSPKEEIPDFVSTRESILQVIGNLTSARSYFDFFRKEVDQTTMELEETEMEMELLKGEHQAADLSLEYQDWHRLPFASTCTNDKNRLQQIKDEIQSIEKLNLRKEIVARRQQKLQMRRARQQFLENAALREAELLQKIDRERTSEVEKELERQQMLELERAKTRQLRHNLDMEKEKQAQRELQRELEQMESGTRPSRREYPSSSQSRTRDRYRERENDKETNEGTLRTSTRNTHRDSAPTSTPNAPTVMLSGSRSFSGQPPTILQSRERSEDTGSVEDNFDGSRDSGDTGSIGDPDMVAALEGHAGSGSGQRSRGSKSRQLAREREGRREGKWERKH